MTILQFVPLLVMLGVYAAFLKLAARIGGIKVTWRHCFLFALFLGAAAIGGRALVVYGGTTAYPILRAALGIALNVALAAWFFRSRGTTQTGEPVGWLGGVKLSLISMGLLIGTSAILFGVLRVFGPHAQP